MKTKLTHGERIIILNHLQVKGSILTLRIVRGLMDKLAINPGEIKKFKITEKNGQITWDPKTADQTREFTLTDFERDLIKEKFKELSDKNELSMDCLTVYEKFFA
jgi:hypothetical protein